MKRVTQNAIRYMMKTSEIHKISHDYSEKSANVGDAKTHQIKITIMLMNDEMRNVTCENSQRR